ncbi:hypothetical protein [Neorhizobium galegae]|uniref:DUF680 domain-containing protein n=1 Tax=Neorhizobium galegae TaxID=399 RepID=A0A6A1TND1_NEOGA|nr:hypothetical protein [Neorhizobium galegae]KAB1085838.1 hypothetical protein F4V91_04955 [Neorhizobium galegae]MCQ1850083.1 hypothetical protein [Neorhizobium galegae]CDZ48199.1 Hypothetical protein NGAL_HAMBI2427_25640 [Neorhizobium galegae bv. orientalis]
MSKFTSTIAATLIATASFATAALASGGTYYEGAVEPAPSQSVASSHQAAPKAQHPGVSYGHTGSVSSAQGSSQSFDGTVTLNRGDYYEGAVRPN